MFKEAIKQEAKLRLAVAGPSGSGKTYTSLAIGTHMGKKIALVDTEHGSASKYADLFHFDVQEMEPPFSVDRFIKCIQEAQAREYDVLILDSLSHMWNGTGGLLEQVDQIARARYQGNSFAAWKDVTPLYNKLVDVIIQSDIHIIATMRTKQDYIVTTDEKGKSKPQKVGLAPIQREGFEYEFDVVLMMDIENNAVVTKTRAASLHNKIYPKPGKDFAVEIMEWLKGAPRVETVDVYGDKAVGYAAKAWNISPNEAREAIDQAVKEGKLKGPFTKQSFKEFVNSA
jgi:hypothetical protein